MNLKLKNTKSRPFKVTGFIPFQVMVINLDEYIEKRGEFATGSLRAS